jgi:hypothetical protein
MNPAARRFEIRQAELPQTRWVDDPDATRPLAPGQARLEIAHYALTANNITYAAFGAALKYWDFFPAGDAGWGCIPVWGFADVVESRAEGLAAGERVYGYLPMGSHLVVNVDRLRAAGFVDAARHRAELAPVYNQYQRCAADPAWAPAQEAAIALLRPLFITSFLIDDFLAEQNFFGAAQVLLSSASSKTAYGTAHRLALRRGQPGTPRIVGLTSPGNLDFCRGLGCYDGILRYDEVGGMPGEVPSVYVDFAGDAGLRRAVHQRFADRLMHSAAIGGTHWEQLGNAKDLPGPRPTLFFAPALVKQRTAAPPAGWGPAGFAQRVADAWQGFMSAVGGAGPAAQPWLVVQRAQGEASIEAAYRQLLGGRTDPRTGLMLAP